MKKQDPKPSKKLPKENAEPRSIRLVEVYLPKRLKYLSPIYNFLRASVENRLGSLVLDGFSVYEVDGTFWAGTLYEERTLVIRLMFIDLPHQKSSIIDRKINEIGHILSHHIAGEELEIWISSNVQKVHIFKGATAPPITGGI